jgi:hypothetical protein
MVFEYAGQLAQVEIQHEQAVSESIVHRVEAPVANGAFVDAAVHGVPRKLQVQFSGRTPLKKGPRNPRR